MESLKYSRVSNHSGKIFKIGIWLLINFIRVEYSSSKIIMIDRITKNILWPDSEWIINYLSRVPSQSWIAPLTILFTTKSIISKIYLNKNIYGDFLLKSKFLYRRIIGSLLLSYIFIIAGIIEISLHCVYVESQPVIIARLSPTVSRETSGSHRLVPPIWALAPLSNIAKLLNS